MNVLTVHNRYQTAGGEDAVQAAEFRMLSEARGFDVAQLIVDNSEIDSHLALGDQLKLASNTVWNLDAAESVRVAAKSHSADVVHFHNTFPLLSPAVYSAARSTGAAVVQTIHNYRLNFVRADFLRNGQICEACLGRTVPIRGVMHRCYHDSAAQSAVVAAMIGFHNVRGTYDRDVDAFVALTEFGRQKTIEGGLDPERVHVKPNFLADDVEAGPHPRSGFAFVGRLAQEKGIANLLEAARRQPSSSLQIAGTGPLQAEVESASEEGVVSYRGPLKRDDVLGLMRSARAVIFPSIWFEGFPMTILEAFASGTPVIASRIGGIPEIVDDGVNGLLVEPGDVDDLRRALRWADEHPDAMARMGIAARETFEEKYTAEKNLPQLLAIYEAAIEHRKANPPAPRWPLRRN